MLVFEDQKIAYFAVPKNGTTAVETSFRSVADIHVVGDTGPKHMRPKHFYKGRHGLDIRHPEREYCAVMTIRDPIAWLGSFYRYRTREAARDAPTSTFGISYTDFVVDYLKDNKPPHAKIGSQSYYFQDMASWTFPYRIYPYDNFANMLVYLNVKLGAHVIPRKRNRSPIRNLNLPPALLDQLRHHFAEDQKVYDAAKRAGVLVHTPDRN